MLSQSEEKAKNPIIIILILIVLMAIILGYIFVSGEPDEENVNSGIPSDGSIGEEVDDNIVGNEEKEVSFANMHKIYEWIPKMNMEGSAPFSEEFKLTAAMDKVSQLAEPNYTYEYILSIVKALFGEKATLDKSRFSIDKVDFSNSKYYYMDDTNMFYMVPMGFENVYNKQILKTVTSTEDYVYVYTYDIMGEYYFDESGKTTVIIGDKNGKDIVKEFESLADIENYDIWVDEYVDILPIYKYTLKKVDDGYNLVSVFHINY